MSQVYVFTDYGGPETETLIDRDVPEPGPEEVVADFAAGDEVLGPPVPGYGGFAEHTVVRADSALLKPEDVSFVHAATIPVAATTAYDLTHVVDLEAGASVLILGAGGGVGYMAVQICAVHQFRTIAVASEAKRELLESTGATFVPSGDGVAAKVRELAPGGIDLVIDLVGGEALRGVAGLAVSPDRVVSAADPDTAVELGGLTRPSDPGSMEKIAEVISYELVDPYVTATFPLTQAREALAAVETGHAEGKVVITP
ncbi:NADP-dependent oxidoreductase [Nesterenkonia alkaliphila]|uniref:Zinc-binding dehydrogenase n=1 Tax=Nesterenkonia alkaliphila TaxID=1463631 RepID=A0A7K1UKS5_9MICC|nr:NADP-dependent oxidoreductase [Nesterenkonia alkaliphila]MVT27070.1 zinc-binding dehydrogenase [Nesterenkonia alkaliphila]GFZ99767.1 NADPH:quinone reductase [Nesterenkonia alkaliphila]